MEEVFVPSHLASGGHKEWAVAIFAARETPGMVRQAVAAVIAAARLPTVIDVLVNGNEALAEQLEEDLASAAPAGGLVEIRLWLIRYGDKAHTWNQYVHTIWPDARCTFFIDGYVRVLPDALAKLDDGMTGATGALAASGVPSSGRTAARLRSDMLRDGGLHGNLYALAKAAMVHVRQASFKLPVGIYRTDSALGSALGFGFEPARHAWSPREFIHVEAHASWLTDEKQWWRYSDLSGQLKRKLRQAQGTLENLAVRQWLAIEQRLPEHLPSNVVELVLSWAAAHPADARQALRRNPLAYLALRKLREPRDWGGVAVMPRLCLACGGSQVQARRDLAFL